MSRSRFRSRSSSRSGSRSRSKSRSWSRSRSWSFYCFNFCLEMLKMIDLFTECSNIFTAQQYII